MEKNRLIDLLEDTIFKMNEVTPNVTYSGICSVFNTMRRLNCITDEEKQYLKAFLYRHKPNHKQYVKFTENAYWKDGSFWWIPMSSLSATIKIRTDYLLAIIHKVRNGEQ